MRVPNLGETELLVPLHEGVFEQPMWQTFLERLRNVTGAHIAVMFFQPPDRDRTVELATAAVPAVVGLDDFFVETDERGSVQQPIWREGRVYSLEELIETGGERKRRFYESKLAPHGLNFMRAMRLREESGLDAWLVLLGKRKLGAEVGNLLAALASHLRVALRVLATLERERVRSTMNAEAISRMRFGWISIDAKCGIVDTDEKADRFLQRSGALRRGHYDRLTASSPEVDRQLTVLAREFAKDPHARPRALNLSRDPWIDILVSPLRVDALSAGPNAVAMVYFRGDESSIADRCEQLEDVFDLTPSEARLAW